MDGKLFHLEKNLFNNNIINFKTIYAKKNYKQIKKTA